VEGAWITTPSFAIVGAGNIASVSAFGLPTIIGPKVTPRIEPRRNPGPPIVIYREGELAAFQHRREEEEIVIL
jgi:hypothetical protein